jgi:transposase
MSTTSSTPMPTTGSLQLVEAVVGRLEGAPVGERRRWSEEFKAKAVAAALEPGVNVSGLARRLGISPPQLFGWRKAFLNKQNEDVPVGSSASVVEIVVGEVVIRVSPDLEEAALRRILRAVRSA